MISIIIPTKNEEELLPTLLRSIKKQTLAPHEVIVADAYSDDNTRDIARSFGCKVIDGGMPGAGRNLGADVATGEFLLFLDADVELTDPRFLEKSTKEIKKKKLDFATCDVVAISDKKLDHLFHKVYNKYVRFCHPFGGFGRLCLSVHGGSPFATVVCQVHKCLPGGLHHMLPSIGCNAVQFSQRTAIRQ